MGKTRRCAPQRREGADDFDGRPPGASDGEFLLLPLILLPMQNRQLQNSPPKTALGPRKELNDINAPQHVFRFFDGPEPQS
jgi:hypothetical protein